MLDERLSLTLCTDNRTISRATVTGEYRLAVDSFGINPKQLGEIVQTGFKRSFFPAPYTEKRKYVRKVIDYYERLAKQYLQLASPLRRTERQDSVCDS